MRASSLAITDRPLVARRSAVVRTSQSAVLDLADEIGAALDGPVEAKAARIVSALRLAAGSPDLLSADQVVPRTECYARHALHADPEGRFTVLALVWGPGQLSPVHAHHTWCAYAMRSGVLTETLYRFDSEAAVAVASRTEARRAGHACHGEAGLDQIHCLGNAGTEPAISIHVYGVEAARIATGVNRVLAGG